MSEVELFITLQPEGDPAQHLVEEVLFRAAKKAGTIQISVLRNTISFSFFFPPFLLCSSLYVLLKILNVTYLALFIAGMDFHELLEIPQGDRRRYHDDVSIIVISLEGRIWRSCV